MASQSVEQLMMASGFVLWDMGSLLLHPLGFPHRMSSILQRKATVNA